MTRRTASILAMLAIALALLGSLSAALPSALAQPPDPALYFTANLPAPVSITTTTPLEQALLDQIAAAQLSIDAAFYDFDRASIRDALIAAKTRGLAVRAVTDLETRTGADGPNVDALVAAGIPVVDDDSALQTLSRGPSTGEAIDAGPIMHDKYLIFDHARVWTGSTNLSNNDIARNHNYALVFDNADVAAVYQYDFDQMFAGQFTSAKTPSLTTTVDYHGSPVEIYFAPQDEPMTHVLAAVNGAQTSIDFAIFYFTDDALRDALLAAKARGVQVRGLWDTLGAGNAFSEDEALCAAGVPIKIEDTPGLMHNKFMAIDAGGANPKVLTGSLNWTAAANDQNSENTVIVHDEAAAQTYAAAFQGMWEGLANVAPCAPSAPSIDFYLPLVARPAATPTPTLTPTPTATPRPTQPPATATPTPTQPAQGPCACYADLYNCRNDSGCWRSANSDASRNQVGAN